MENVVICISGKARPMPSASTTGRSSAAAVTMGSSPLPPPISAEIRASILAPRNSSRARSTRTPSVPSSSFSIDTAGAPMPPMRQHQGVVLELIEPEEPDAPAALELLEHAQLGDVGIAAAARAQDGGADGERLDIRWVESAHDLSS